MDLSRDLTPIKVGDLVFLVKLDYGRYKRLAREQAQLSTDSDDSLAADAMIGFMDKTIREVVVSVQGLTRDGEPVAWTPEVLEELPLAIVRELFEGICNPGEAVNPTTPSPAATSEAPPGD